MIVFKNLSILKPIWGWCGLPCWQCEQCHLAADGLARDIGDKEHTSSFLPRNFIANFLPIVGVFATARAGFLR